MDDQRTDRESGKLRGGFQISLGRMFGVMFWASVFCGLVTLFHGPPPAWFPRREPYGSITAAVVFVLLVSSPCLALGTLFNRPVVGVILGAVVICAVFILLMKNGGPINIRTDWPLLCAAIVVLGIAALVVMGLKRNK